MGERVGLTTPSIVRLEDIGAHEGLRSVGIAVSFDRVLICTKQRTKQKVRIAVVLYRPMLTNREMRLTDMKVPGKKNKVTSVMTFIETVSILVLRAMSFMSSVMVNMLLVESLFA